MPFYAAPFLHLASVSREMPAHDKPERLGGWIYRALGLLAVPREKLDGKHGARELTDS
jgi:hypothetical protein